ncbi:hypothetical protein [Streptomyces nitrosporeus]|uniref:hypothetical protein n=1 Tax=Streptomyces nitrosporeus TaxID=28894 RepID=UPI0039A3EC83
MTTDGEVLARVVAGGEEWPDGTYGASRLVRPPYVPGEPDPAAAVHVQELAKALKDWRCGDRAELADRADRLQAGGP